MSTRKSAKQKATATVAVATVVTPEPPYPFVVDTPIISTTLIVDGNNRTTHGDLLTMHDVSVELQIYEGAGKDPRADDVFLSLTRNRGVYTRGFSGEHTHPDRITMELSIYELEPLIAALGCLVNAAKAKGFIPPHTAGI